MNSISDTPDYKNFCELSSQDDLTFNNFKTNEIYNGILEHVSYEQGQLYLDYLKNNFPEFYKNLHNYKKNDIYGHPKVHYYQEVGYISPTTLRYIKVLADLKNLFGDLTNKKIIEIGVGYGGQCLIVNQEFGNDNYTLIDLDEVLNLSSKYLSKLNVSYKIVNISEVQNLDEEFDLVISNYAYSELTKELQDLYYEKIIKKSKQGYFTLNFISHFFNIDSYSLEELVNKFEGKNCEILEETPSTFENNKILYFKN